MLFIFCIVVHNGTEHILLLDFLWAHPNSLDWPIKSSGGPNNVCDIYMNIFIYIYIYRDVCIFLESIFSSFWELSRQTQSHAPLWTEFWGLKGRAHWSLILGASRTRKADYWTSKVAEIASQSTNQGNGRILLLNACLIVNMWSYAI